MTADDLPLLRTAIPGPASRALVDVLARHECPAITARRSRRAAQLGAADDDPIVWEAAYDALVIDADGNRFVDLTSGFGVALLGHRHPVVVQAAARQAERLVHAMGDAFPDQSRIRLLAELASIAPDPLSISILGLSGSDAIDAAVKTAVLATRRTGVLVFGRGYHGLALGTVGLQAYHPAFAEPFREIVHPKVSVLPFGCPIADLRAVLPGVGLVLVEPIQGRGGIWPAPDGWLAEVAAETRRAGALLATDEIQSGLGRTGRLWASDVVPDLLCIGKALAGGYPLSACVGTPEAMAAWGASTGEAIHTQTFLGHPIGCAAALAAIAVIRDEDIPGRCAERGERLASALTRRGWGVRGRGLMRAVEIGTDALAASRHLLRRGYLALPAGATSISLTPPVTLSDAQIEGFAAALAEAG
jgi:4-aminobutyrate aminotransferase/(S)-3-amino-2-methylpropionate transaminase